MDPEWLCTACKDGRHFDCDFWRGCECSVRLGPDRSGVWLCESLLPYKREERPVTVWNLLGTAAQNALVQRAIDRCDFDFSKLLPSLQREGKTSIRAEWADLSRYAASDGKGHDHVHDGEALAHPIERVVDGRQRVLGLFYLPPYTKVVLDVTLERDPTVAQEVFLAESAHAVDYHFLTREHRRAFTNSVHTQQLPVGAATSDGVAFSLDGHTCSWFDVGAYADWVGEAFMEGFIEATSDVPVTINLRHPVGPEDRAVIRQFLGIDAALPPAADQLEADLAAALRRFLATKGGERSPLYLRDSARAWLAAR